MTTLDGFQLYSKFLILRKHLTDEEYNFYHHTVGMPRKTFYKLKDKAFAESLARKKKLDNRDAKHFMLFNMVAHEGDLKKYWIGNLMKPEADNIYDERRRYWESMLYYFSLDFFHIVDTAYAGAPLGGNATSTMIELYYAKQIHPESISVACAINKKVGEFLLDKNSRMPYNEAIKLIKYGQLMEIDTEYVLSGLKRK